MLTVDERSDKGWRCCKELRAEASVILTDVDAVYLNWGKQDQRAIRRASPDEIAQFSFAAGSMGPKVEAACDFVRKTKGMAAS